MTSERRLVLAAAAAVLVVHGAYALYAGPSLSPDAATFARWADRLISLGFDYGALLRTFDPMNVPPVTYLAFVTLVAVAKVVAGEGWLAVLVAINVLCNALTASLVVRVAIAARGFRAGLVALAFYLAAFDIAAWTRFPLTDIPFLFVSFAAPAFIFIAPRPNRVLIVFFTLAALVLRPVGFLWALLVALAMLVAAKPQRLRWLPWLAIPAIALFLAHTWAVQHPERWDSPMLQWDARQYAAGEVVDGRPDTAHAKPSSFLDYAAITADRFRYFFAFTAKGFSRAHALYGVAYYVPLYALALAALFRRRDVIVSTSALFVLVVAFWHALVIVDFDWRYRLPVMPHLIVMAACGAASLPRLRGR
jgi:hypothetical protein